MQFSLAAFAWRTNKEDATHEELSTSIKTLQLEVKELKDANDERTEDNSTVDADKQWKFHQFVQENHPTWNAFIKIQNDSLWKKKNDSSQDGSSNGSSSGL